MDEMRVRATWRTSKERVAEKMGTAKLPTAIVRRMRIKSNEVFVKIY